MVTLVNRAKMSTATTGTGDLTLGSAEDGYQSFAAAGVIDGNSLRYVIEDGTAWEIGAGTYTATGTTMSRRPSESSNAGAAIALSGFAVIYVTATAADFMAGVGSAGDIFRELYIYTATAAQTVFSGADDSLKNLSIYTAGYTNVYANGILLVETTDFSIDVAANTVTLLAAASLDDVITIEVFAERSSILSHNIDGGTATSIYLPSQSINGGAA